MKNLLAMTMLGAMLCTMPCRAQSPVATGQGSYASFPPAEELQFTWEGVTTYADRDFVYNNPIYVLPGEKRPIPTNDWWTDILVSRYGGLLYAYPMVAQPTDRGLQLQYPISFVPDGSNLDRGTGIEIKANGFAPDKALASNWSDWMVEMQLPDESSGANMKVTLAHGMPMTWVETIGMNPGISALAGANYLNADGTPVNFPVAAGGAFVLQSEGKLFGIHLGNGVTAEMQGKQYVQIDLGSSVPLTALKLHWEAAYASGYTIKTSVNNQEWLTQHTVTNGDGNIDHLTLSGDGRYVRIELNTRGTVWAYSLWEVSVLSGTDNVALNKPVIATSTEGAYAAGHITDGNDGTRWASDATAQEALVLNMNNGANYFVVSALTQLSDLSLFNTCAHNKPVDTHVVYAHDAKAGRVNVTWNVTTTNLKGQPAGDIIQGFIPHQYKHTLSSDVTYTGRTYVTSRGAMKTAIGRSFSFSYPFQGMVPSFSSPFKNTDDANPYSADVMYQLLTNFSASKTGYGGDTYWGGKDLVNLAKYTLMAKELGHQSYETLKARTRAALVDWLTYTPGETAHYFARYDRWKALIGFDQSYGSAQFTDNHFHYGYLIHAAALYGMLDAAFLSDYGDMLKLVTQQYANWQRNDPFLPYLRTFDPWMGHSYAGGISSGGGNNQESTSEAMQSWIGMYLLSDLLGDDQMRHAAAFGYTSEAAATLEYWFDWEQENLPQTYPHNMVGILWNGGYSYGTFFSASPVHIHGIQYLPVCPGFSYLARNAQWAAREYADMMSEAAAVDGHADEIAFGDDWAHVALGFRQLFDPAYVTRFMADNMTVASTDSRYIMDYEVSGMTYYYAHALQNLGSFSTHYHTNLPTSAVFEKNGVFSHAVVFNALASEQTCRVYNAQGGVVASFNVPAHQLVTYPQLPSIGQQPESCYALSASVSATSGNAGAAFDASMGTRWIAGSTDVESYTIDLGLDCSIEQMTIAWEVANAAAYVVEASNDGSAWRVVKAFSNMPQGNRTDVVNEFGDPCRYLRLTMTAASTPWNYSIYEIILCGTAGSATLPDGVTVPTSIEAENYESMSGIQTEPTTDTGGGVNVGWIDHNDYLTYRIHVPQSVLYQVDFRVASLLGGGNILFQVDGQPLATLAVPSTGGWQSWVTLTTPIHLTAGSHQVKLLAQPGGYNINWFDIRLSGGLKSASLEIVPLPDAHVGMSVYPNPVSDLLNVSLVGMDDALLEVIDMHGRRLYAQRAGVSMAPVIDVSQWSTGIYTLKAIAVDGHVCIQRFVVK